VNGVKLIDLNDSSHTGGLGVGVTATSFDEADLDVRFDDYTVLPIGCGLSSGEQPAGISPSLPADTSIPAGADQPAFEMESER
jgi:hypothetical protein